MTIVIFYLLTVHACDCFYEHLLGCQLLSLCNIPMQPTASAATTACCSPYPLNNYKHSPIADFTTDHKYFHRPAKGAQQRGYRGKIMNTMMTYLIKYPFQQKMDGGIRRVKERSKLRDCRSSGERVDESRGTVFQASQVNISLYPEHQTLRL